MTIKDIADRILRQRPGAMTKDELIDHLHNLDMRIKTEVVDTHEGWQSVFVPEYSAEDEETELLVSAPYDAMYGYYLESRIDYAQQEYGKFNNSNAMFQAEYTAFRNYYNQCHAPLGTRMRYF